jgi:penicillin-binding protein 2
VIKLPRPRRRRGGLVSAAPALTPRIAVRIAAIGVVGIALLGLLLVRLWFLQVIGGQAYAAQATANKIRTIYTEGERGLIVDRTGRNPLVRNRVAHDVVLRPQEVTGRRRDLVLARLARVLRVPQATLAETADRAIEQAPYQPVVLAEDIDPQVQLYLSERRQRFPGVTIQDTYVRAYPEGGLAAQALGYTGAITPEQARRYRRLHYLGTEHVGQSGVEAVYERYLHGSPGRTELEVDASGTPVRLGALSATPPEPGSTLMLSIDLTTQRALMGALQDVRGKLANPSGAAGVALDPRTGEVLAIASLPTFNPAAFADGRAREVQRIVFGPGQRTFNRAIGGQYPPGSTFKAITAAAGMQEGILGAGETIFSPGRIVLYEQLFKGFNETPWGDITVPYALRVSSDTFFYEVGKRFYERDISGESTPLQDYARRFGLGKPTGIDLAGEERGFLPDVEWKVERFKDSSNPGDHVWLPGDDIQMAIGQGYVTVTPIQMAVAYAAIANGGTIVTPTLGRAILSPDGGLRRDLLKGRPTRPLGVAPEIINVIRGGLYSAANEDYGTSVGVFGGLPATAKVAGKTGTAENPQGLDHSWFVGYAPYNNPEIVVAVIVEHGGQGANAAAPVVCKTIAAKLKFEPGLCGTGARID